jgi:hypothetical protein
MTDFLEEEIWASFMVLVIGKLVRWGDIPIGGGGQGDPHYLTGAQAEALAAEGIRLLARYLPQEAAEEVTATIKPLARAPHHHNREQALVQVGALGGLLVGGDDPPGCCVFEPDRGLVCVRRVQ